MRNNMVGTGQIYVAEHFKQDIETKIIDLENDIPDTFKFSYYENMGNRGDNDFIVPNRVTPVDNIKIKTDYQKVIQNDIVRINNNVYGVTKVEVLHNPSYDLRAIRGFQNETYIIELDMS